MNDYNKIPTELKDVKQWVNYILAWNEEERKHKKIPINPHTMRGANTTDSATWANFDNAVKNIGKTGTIWNKQKKAEESNEVKGIGFVLDNGYFGIDLDHVKENGSFTDKAMEIVNMMDSYTEESLSGDGIHILAKDFELTSGMGKRNDFIEMYSSGRFFVMTGKSMNDKGIEERSVQAIHLWNTHLKKNDTPQMRHTASYGDINVSDSNLTRCLIRAQARKYRLYGTEI